MKCGKERKGREVGGCAGGGGCCNEEEVRQADKALMGRQ